MTSAIEVAGLDIGAVKNDIGHAIATKVLGALLPHHPQDGVDNITLSATIRPHNARDTVVKGKDSPIKKRLEAL